MDTPQRPNRAEGYNLEPLDDELLLYHPARTQAIYMNATATLIWGLCDGRPIEAITETLVAAYPDAAATLPAEVRATVEKLAAFAAIVES